LLLAKKGWLIGFQNTLQAMQLAGKKKVVQLQDGSVITNMGGDRAPELWEKGEYAATTRKIPFRRLNLLRLCITGKKYAGAQNPLASLNDSRPRCFPSVKQCMELPLPDLSWMNSDKKKPVSRQEFLAWALRE